MPNHQVPRFQAMAPVTPARMMPSEATPASEPTSMNVPMVSATAVPPRSGPRNSKTATTMTAWIGVMARDAITVATMFEAS